MSKESALNQRMEKIVSLCKRRGFIFQSSEIYGGLNGFWDYGPLGVELKRNLKDFWWRRNVREREDMVGMDGSIIMNRAVWKASGHEDTFSDPMVDCLLTKQRFRADQIPPQSGEVYWFSGARSAQTGWRSDKTFAVLIKKGENAERARKVAKQFYAQGSIDALIDQGKSLELIGERVEEMKNSTRFNPETGSLLTEPRAFNLMFKSFAGPLESDENLVYLRPETAQAIFVQFKNVLETSRQKLPFGIAQIGKAFRNEINPRNYTFRSREFEQMEIEYFCRAEEGLRLTDYWLEERLRFYEDIGIPRSKIRVHDIPDEERAFYSKKTYDLEYDFPFGVSELEGIAYRTDYDLSRHIEFSGKPLEYFDEETKQKFVPHVVEPSAGVDRTALALLCEAYDEELVPGENGKSEMRTVLRLHPRMAPVKCGIFPLLKNKPELVAKAREIAAALRPLMAIFYDEAGAIGRRYRRQDEAGTPFGVTVDFDTIGENGPARKDTVTLRHRDSMKQDRMAISELKNLLLESIA
jgi:glycyl-tRNA synthetase